MCLGLGNGCVSLIDGHIDEIKDCDVDKIVNETATRVDYLYAYKYFSKCLKDICENPNCYESSAYQNTLTVVDLLKNNLPKEVIDNADKEMQ